MTISTTRPTLNTHNANRDWNTVQLAEGAKLAALLAAGQEPKGYARDSVGQWFKDGVLIPSPPKAQTVRGQVPLIPLTQ